MQDPGLWANTVRRICVESDTYLPSYPLEKMTILELQRAALSPTLCRALLSKADTVLGELVLDDASVLKATERKVVMGPWRAKESHTQCYLVPGGRFLLTCGKTSGLCLWDVGIPGSELLDQPVLVAKADTGDLQVWHGVELSCIVFEERVRVVIQTLGQPFR